MILTVLGSSNVACLNGWVVQSRPGLGKHLAWPRNTSGVIIVEALRAEERFLIFMTFYNAATHSV
jgi:hypothetical protein